MRGELHWSKYWSMYGSFVGSLRESLSPTELDLVRALDIHVVEQLPILLLCIYGSQD